MTCKRYDAIETTRSWPGPTNTAMIVLPAVISTAPRSIAPTTDIPVAWSTPSRMRSGRPAPWFCATNVDTASPSEASSAMASPSTRVAVV